jgi:hypothetical protein
MASPASRMLAAPLSGMACTGDESNDCAAKTAAAAAKTITDLRIASFLFSSAGGWELVFARCALQRLPADVLKDWKNRSVRFASIESKPGRRK